MDPSLIDARFSSLFKELRDLDRSERAEILAVVAMAGGLGYWLLGSTAGFLTFMFFSWLLRAIPYSMKRDRIRSSLSDLALSYPEEAEAAIARSDIYRTIEDASRRRWFQ